jgi:hypothetical protein
MHAVVAEELAHCAASIGGKELQRRRLGGGGGNHDRVVERTVILQRLDDLGDGRALLADRDIDAVELLRLVGTRVDALLIEDGVDGDCGLAGLAVADDELALTAADRHQRVDRLEARLHRLVHRFARNDAGRLDLDARALDVGERTLAVDRIAERVDDAAEQAAAHGHLDDGAGALHHVAFADAAIVSEHHDADIVGLEVERHALHAVGELDHLAGLDLVQPVDARDAVTDRQHLPDLGDIGLGTEIGDLLLQDCGDFRCPDFHRLSPLHRKLQPMQLAAQRRIDHARSNFDDKTAEESGIHPDLDGDLTTHCLAQLLVDRIELRRRQRLRRNDLRGDFASTSGEPSEKGIDHRRHGKEPPVLCDQTEEAARQRRQPGTLGDGGDRAPLLEPRENRAAHQAAQLGTLVQHCSQLTKILGNLIQRLALVRQIEQRRGVAVGKPGNACALRCQSREILDILALVASART